MKRGDTVLVCMALLSFFCCLGGFYSWIPNRLMHRAFSEHLNNILSKVQYLFNWSFCVVLVIITIINFFIHNDLTLLGGIIFFAVMFVNFIYCMIIYFFTYKIIKESSLKYMMIFLDHYKDKEFQCEQEIIHSFCREYRDFSEKEAHKALKKIKRRTII